MGGVHVGAHAGSPIADVHFTATLRYDSRVAVSDLRLFGGEDVQDGKRVFFARSKKENNSLIEFRTA